MCLTSRSEPTPFILNEEFLRLFKDKRLVKYMPVPSIDGAHLQFDVYYNKVYGLLVPCLRMDVYKQDKDGVNVRLGNEHEVYLDESVNRRSFKKLVKYAESLTDEQLLDMAYKNLTALKDSQN